MKCPKCAFAVAGLGSVAVLVAGSAGHGAARDALSAIVITFAAAVSFMVAAMFFIVIRKWRSQPPVRRADAAVMRSRYRAEVTVIQSRSESIPTRALEMKKP